VGDLEKIWRRQIEQQSLWHSWEGLSDDDKSALTKELILGMYEELGELQKRLDIDKYHIIMKAVKRHPAAVAEDGIDVMKYLVALMALHGVTPEMMLVEFNRKTMVVDAKWKAQCDSLRDVDVLLCDLDDCVADWAHGFPAWTAARGIDINGAPEGSLEQEKAKERFYAEGGFLTLGTISGAVNTLSRWRGRTHEYCAHAVRDRRLIMVTSRPYRRHTRVYADTMEWCDKVGLGQDHIIFTNDKADAVRQMQPARIIAMIEDRHKYASELAAIGVKVLKLPGWDDIENFKHANVLGCRNWDDIKAALANI